MTQHFHCGRHVLNAERPLIMGIVNLSDDSFSGDGLCGNAAAAIGQGWRLVEEGAHILDLGAESSRPGAMPVPTQMEIGRLLPVIEGLQGCGVPLSVDTVKPEVMRAVLAAGADMINDINALRAPGAMELIAASRAAVGLMHMQGEPRTMQEHPHYADVVGEVAAFLAERVAAAEAAGIALNRIAVDPGFGFGKTLEHNVELLRRLDELVVPGLPLLVGMSRKSMLGLITGRAAPDRVHAGIAANVLAVLRGARILRVHDVAATRDAVAVLQAVEDY
ncbi:MAG: dihydropteroate synthase [Sterolibacteriaceae bacterium]|uniref:dihydropteroate synthase n=1 Tax=Sulfuritalea sp. TaxID=2480090 RepID=UPI001A5E0991|nr:dihydropteroate synthase [Sulfuritalea sp.]MBL8477926.1 dihydropteroate synthase [Sterolibacteriaceae bacterium]MBN8475694.1 dihydropteroate synthase [Sulfuritalea sp.]